MMDIGLCANFEIRNDTGFNESLASFDSESRQEPDIMTMRLSESGR